MSSAEGGSGRGILGRILQAPVRVAGIAAAVVALVVSALTGGLEQARPPGPPEIAAKTMLANRPWNVTVTGAGYATKADPLRTKTEGDHWIAVGATIEVTADASRNDISSALTLIDIPGLRDEKPSTIVLSRDDKQLPTLHPGMPEKLLFFWEIDGKAARPVQADVQIWGKTLRVFTLTNTKEWVDPEIKAHVVLPIQDLDKQ